MSDVENEAKALLGKLLKDSSTRKATLKAIKKVSPETAIPELDADDALDERFAAMQAELDKERKLREDAELDKRLASERGKLRSAGYTDEGITAVEDIMQKEHIASHEAAAALFEKRNPPAQVKPSYTPPGFTFTNKELPVSEDLLHSNPERWMEEMATGILNGTITE